MMTSEEFEFTAMEAAERLREQVWQLRAENKRLRKLLSDARDLAHGKRPPGFPISTSAPTEWEDKRDFWRSVDAALEGGKDA